MTELPCPFKIGDVVKFNEEGMKLVFSRPSEKSRFKVVKIGPGQTGFANGYQMPGIYVQRIDISKKSIHFYWPGYFTKVEEVKDA